MYEQSGNINAKKENIKEEKKKFLVTKYNNWNYLNRQNKESVKLKIGQLKLLTLRNRKKKKTKEKWTRPKVPVRHHQVEIIPDWSPRRKKDRETCRDIIWRNNGWKLPKFDERNENKHTKSSTNSK